MAAPEQPKPEELSKEELLQKQKEKRNRRILIIVMVIVFLFFFIRQLINKEYLLIDEW